MIKKVKELSAKDFDRYGAVMDWKDASLSSTSENHDYWDGVCEFHPEGPQVCSFLRIKKSFKTPVYEMERHNNTEEMLVAIKGDIIINVADASGKKDSPDEATISSFYVQQGSGVVMKKGVWHSLPCTLSVNNSMTLVVFRQNTSFSEDEKVETDIHFAKLQNPFKLEL